MKLPEKQFLTLEQTQSVFDEIDSKFIDISPVAYNPELFDNYKRIFIIGPQRSGTTFTSKAIAKTLNFQFVDEEVFGVRDFNKFKTLFKRENIVVQAPAMTSKIHVLAGKDDLVVFMSRKWSDIVKSVYKKNGKISNWVFMNTMYEIEKSHYVSVDQEAGKVFDEVVDKNSYYLNCFYTMWKNLQSKVIPNCFALDYASMSNHPMWKDKALRKNFHFKQTS